MVNTIDKDNNTVMLARSPVDYKRTGNISLINKAYVWSVVFEPLLFFVLWDEWITGVGGNLSRILQTFVIIALLLKYFLKSSGPVRIINFANPLYRNYGIYLGIAIFAGLLSVVCGAYDIEMTFSSLKQSSFANQLNSSAVRPVFEYVISIYYFTYFVVLPRYLFKSEGAVDYFFSIFRVTFIISLVVGFVGLAFEYFSIRLVPCHIANWPQWAGVRFHGLAGEPRHAFIYLFLGLAIFKLEAYVKGQALSKLWLVVIIAAALLTQSASGIVGIAVFFFLLSADSLTCRMDSRQVFLFLLILILTPLLIYIVMSNSSHLTHYLASISGLWDLLETKGELPYYMKVQSNEIYPLYDLIVKTRDLNILPIIIGSGLGSASFVNNYYASFASGQMINPNSQLVRSLFESGLIGTFFLIMSFIYPVKQMTKHMAFKHRFSFIVLTWLLIGCFMGIRSSAPFIYLGIFLAVFFPYGKTNKEEITKGC